jgi:hypothetical protein
MLEEKGVQVQFEADTGDTQNQPTLNAFIPGGDTCGVSSGAGRHAFFKIRRMQKMKVF